MTWQKCSVFIFGTVDYNKCFHPAGLFISKFKKADDHQYLLDSLKTAFKKLRKVEYEPDFLLADTTCTKTDKFRKAFQSTGSRIVCWEFAICAIDQELKSIEHEEIREKIRNDILEIHLSYSPEFFSKAIDLFDKKWRESGNEKVDSFLKYFKSNWCPGSTNTSNIFFFTKNTRF